MGLGFIFISQVDLYFINKQKYVYNKYLYSNRHFFLKFIMMQEATINKKSKKIVLSTILIIL